jgi:hypothetical protein
LEQRARKFHFSLGVEHVYGPTNRTIRSPVLQLVPADFAGVRFRFAELGRRALTSATKSSSKKAIKSALLNFPKSLAAVLLRTEMKSKAKLLDALSSRGKRRVISSIFEPHVPRKSWQPA